MAEYFENIHIAAFWNWTKTLPFKTEWGDNGILFNLTGIGCQAIVYFSDIEKISMACRTPGERHEAHLKMLALGFYLQGYRDGIGYCTKQLEVSNVNNSL